jgi:hypothetical protein
MPDFASCIAQCAAGANYVAVDWATATQAGGQTLCALIANFDAKILVVPYVFTARMLHWFSLST